MSEPEAPHYAEAFTTGRSGCFRFIADHAGRPMHCLEPPAWTGTHRDAKGRRYRVRACEGHRGGVENARRLKAWLHLG